MPKQLNVSLAFTADTAQAKRQIQELQQSLAKLSSDTIKNNIGNKMTEDLQKSVVAASQLKDMLQQAVNPNTGNLDLSRFSEQLKASGRDIQSYARDLNNLGPEGTKTFMQLAQSIASAEVPMRRTNALMKEFGVTLMNAARWQFSSSVLHGLMGAIQGAYSYAQNLDESLTNIAIVTGRSRDEMAQFAEQANKSAQALSTTTTAYTDAALIYYQQGLDDAAVKARTDVTMMMANVTGESAERVSNYMTAIWNNFDDGSKSMEYYADVITALGAATASSSEEIAKGMQQFAAVADTVGLSYEYAATALATIVAQTRQSESTVGNGLRTIFARFDSVKLGDTLEDGVGLTKYTEALAKVGVSVLDQNGQLKEMDEILNAIGEKWETLNKTQQTALAQTVGGVRQYTNLMALFDNWDTFQKNLSVAQGAEGSLETQAQTYAESWEAAQKRVKAAWQAIYQDLIDSDAFITLLDGVEKLLQGVDALIDGMGGLSGVLGVVGAVITTVFADNLAKGIQNAVYNFKVFTGQAQDDADALAMKFKEVADQMGQDLQSPTATAEVGVLKDQIDFALKLRQASDSITEANKQQLLSLNEITKQYGEAYVEAVKLKEAAEEAKGNATYKAREVIGDNVDVGQRKAARDAVGSALNTENLNEQIDNFRSQQNGLSKAFDSIGESLKNGENSFDQYGKVLAALNETSADVIEHQTGLADAIDQVSDKLKSNASEEEKKAALEGLIETFNKTKDSSNALTEFLQDSVVQSAKQIASEFGLSKEATNQLVAAFKEAASAAVELNINTEQADNAQVNYTERLKQAEIEFEKLKGKVSDYSTVIVTCARGMSQLWAAFNAFGKILDTWKNKDLTALDKIKATIPSLLTALPMLINGIRTLSGVQGGLFAALGAGIKAYRAETLLATAGTSAWKVGLDAFNKSLMVTLSELAPFIIGAVTLGAVIWGLVSAFNAWKASTPEGQLEAAKNRLEEASTAAEEAATAYDDLKSSLDEYRQTREDINNIEDSEERTRAINEENDKILEMLENVENWHDLIGDLKYDDNGLISLTDEQLKALENDKAREASLARQLELQEKINVNTANEAVEDNNYSGKKIVAKVETLGGADNNIKQYQKQDITAEIADFLAERGLGAKSEDSKIREALESSERYDESQIDQIIEGINAIENDQASLRQFGEMQTNHLQTMAMNDALEKQQNQLAIDTAQRDMGDKLSLDSFSKFEDVQAQIANEWNLLSEETKEAVRNNTMTLQEAFGDRLNIEQANNEALQKEKEEHDKWREQNVNSVADRVSFSTYGKDENGNYVDNTADKIDSEFSDEDLKIAATLELDKYKSIEELKAAIEEVKQQTEQDRLFQIEMKKAEDAGLDMDEWQRYVDYLQSVNEELAENDVLTAQIATANMRLNKGVASLVDDFDDWRKTLDTINESGDEWAKHSLEYADSMTGIQEALADIGNLDLDTIRSFGEDFVTDNLDLIQEAAYGDADAIDELIKKIAEAQAMKLDIPVDAEINREQFDADRQALIDAIYDTNFEDIEINSSINVAPFYEALEKMVADGALAADDINAFLASVGYSPIVDYVDVPIDDDHVSFDSATGEYTAHDDEGNTYTLSADAVVQNSASEKGLLHIPIIQGSNANGGIGTIATSGATGTIAGALASGGSRFTGGTGAQTSAANRNGGAANRPKSSGCFAAGTLVTVNNNYKNIEDVKIGDIVLSYNEKTKKNEFSEVVQTMIHFVHEKIYNLFIKNDKLVVTGNHKFLITHNGVQEWKQAADIEIGDLVLLANGTLCEISNINIETKFLTVYNFEVSNTHNYYVGKNQILAHNKGKSGGGGKEKAREKKKEKDLEEKKKEEDRYHDLEEAIEDVDTALDRLDKSKDRAFGKDKINFMNLEIKKFKEQIGLTKKYIDEIKKYQKVDRDALEQKLKDIGMSQAEIAKQFDADGILTSYEDLFTKIQDHFNNTALADLNKAREEYNAKVREWNAGGLDEDSWKEVEENLKEAEEIYKEQEKIYNDQLNALKQYEDTTNLLQEKQQELIDQMNDLFDKALDIAREKIEIQLDVNDRDLKHLQWLYENIGDDADRVADRIANLSKQAEVSVKNIKTNADGIRDIFSGLPEAYNGKDGKKLIDFSGIDLGLDISNPEALINTVNQVVAKMREVNAEADIKTFLNDITKYEDGLMEEYRNLSDINKQITENMRDAFNDWRDLLEKNLDTNDHMQDLLQSYQDIAELLGQENMGISDEEMQQWRKSQLEIQRDAAEISKANWEAAKIARQKAKEEYDAAIASGNQLAIEQAKAMLEEAEDFEKDAHKEYLERVKETLRTAEEIYQQSLKNNEKAYQKALSGGIAPTLDRLQEQLDMQKELNHLHLDDYEKYKKLGDLQANINKQLANNPNVKVQGKLKDLMDDVNKKMEAGAEISEGEATILEKRLQLLQAEDQLMAARNAKSAVRMTRDNEGNFSYTYTADTSKIEEAQQNYADKFYDLLDYERKYSEDTQAAILQSYKEFLDKRNDIINDETLTNAEKEALLNQLEKDLQAKVQFYTDEMQMVVGEMGRLKNEDWQDMQQTLGRLLAEDDDFETSFEDTTLAKIAPAWNSAADAMKAFTVAAGQLKADDLQAIADLVNINEASMQNVGTSTLEFGKQLTDVYAQLEEKSDDAKEAAKEMAEETIPKYTEMINKGKEFSEKYGEYFTNVANNIDKVVTAIEKLRKSLAGIEDVGDVTAIFADALGESPEKNTSGQQFDTGGYTGSWGRSGKLAILHQKELVLNEKDTKNILEAVDILRSISGLNSNINVNNNIDYSGLANLGTDSLQQQVHIDASFPNVQSHNEIELALNNLINSASQYVNRKN